MIKKCMICAGPLHWHGCRRLWVCGECLPVDGLPADWPERHPGVPISTVCRRDLSTCYIPYKYRKEKR
jgi:hypothetical protein